MKTLLTIAALVLITSCNHIDQGVCRHKVFESYALAYEHGPAKIAHLKPTSGEGNWHIVTYAPINGEWVYWEPARISGFRYHKNLNPKWTVVEWVDRHGAWEIIERAKRKNEAAGKNHGVEIETHKARGPMTGFDKVW